MSVTVTSPAVFFSPTSQACTVRMPFRTLVPISLVLLAYATLPFSEHHHHGVILSAEGCPCVDPVDHGQGVSRDVWTAVPGTCPNSESDLDSRRCSSALAHLRPVK